MSRDYLTTSCCGGLSPNEFDSNINRAPYKIHRCFKDYNHSKPCPLKGGRRLYAKHKKEGYEKSQAGNFYYKDSSTCCNGSDTCIPTTNGGKCRMRSGRGYYVYNRDGERHVYDSELDKDEEYEYVSHQKSSSLFLLYLNYLILLVITLMIIYYFHKIFVETTEVASEYKYNYGYQVDV